MTRSNKSAYLLTGVISQQNSLFPSHTEAKICDHSGTHTLLGHLQQRRQLWEMPHAVGGSPLITFKCCKIEVFTAVLMVYHVYWDTPWYRRPPVSSSPHRIPNDFSLQYDESDFHELRYKVTQLESNPTKCSITFYINNNSCTNFHTNEY